MLRVKCEPCIMENNVSMCTMYCSLHFLWIRYCKLWLIFFSEEKTCPEMRFLLVFSVRAAYDVIAAGTIHTLLSVLSDGSSIVDPFGARAIPRHHYQQACI